MHLGLTFDSTLFGGPSQPEPLDERGGINRARVMAEEDPSVLNANQYENDAVSHRLHFEPKEDFLIGFENWQSHVKWTGPQIHEQLPHINLICAGMGTSGTSTGLGQYFKHAKPSVTRLGYV